MTFRQRLRAAVEEGILLAVKWALVIVAVLFAANYLLQIRQAALNGAEAHRYLVEQAKKAGPR
jgi:hypothetical protein